MGRLPVLAPCALVPGEIGGFGAVQARHHGARPRRCADAQGNRLAAPESILVEANPYDRRLGDNNEALRLAIDVAIAVAQDEANHVGSIGHFLGCQEAGLPDVLARQIAQGFDQPKGK